MMNGLKRLLGKTPAAPVSMSSLPLQPPLSHAPQIISRDDHCISRQHINKNAVWVLYQLKKARFQAFLVGGGVRDLLVGRNPKDFDIATNATPEEISDIFRNCRLIGRRFRLAHIYFGEEIIEVATFRSHHNSHFKPDEETESHNEQHRVFKNGRIVRDNIYGTLEEDAWRRDFTINALYYNIYDFSVVDYTGGMNDLKARLIRLIGDPLQRYQEDPVRMLRAIRFAAKLDFTIHPETAEPISDMGRLLKDIPSARLYEEVLKLFLSGHGWKSFELLQHYNVLYYLFPSLEQHLPHARNLIQIVLENTDDRKQQNLPISPTFLFAALLWTSVENTTKTITSEQETGFFSALHQAMHEVSHQQHKRVSIPRRIVLGMRDIWSLQPRLEQIWRSKRALTLVEQPRFRAAFDFFLLRAKADSKLEEIADFWKRLYAASPEERIVLVSPPPQTTPAKPKKRRRFKKKPNATGKEPNP
jgi:poly(A) polymerase